MTSVGPVAVRVVVGLGPSRQEHPLETRGAGYCLTKVGYGSSSRVKPSGYTVREMVDVVVTMLVATG